VGVWVGHVWRGLLNFDTMAPLLFGPVGSIVSPHNLTGPATCSPLCAMHACDSIHKPPHPQMAKGMDGARARDLSLQRSWVESLPNHRPEVDHHD
jgi:hypothetical protein